MKTRRFRLTRIGLYFYHRRYTLSFSWRGRWTNCPSLLRHTLNGGWTLVCGPLILERDAWPEGDDWGEQTAEIRLGILTGLLEFSTHEAAEAAKGGE